MELIWTNKQVKNKIKTDLINATKYLIKYFKLNNTGYKLKLSFKKLKPEEFLGLTSINKNKKFILVEINKEPYEKICSFLQVLVHEMVHVKQICDGRLSFDDNNGKNIKWEGKSWNKKFKLASYMELPWEIEAHKLEKKLVDKIRKQN